MRYVLWDSIYMYDRKHKQIYRCKRQIYEFQELEAVWQVRKELPRLKRMDLFITLVLMVVSLAYKHVKIRVLPTIMWFDCLFVIPQNCFWNQEIDSVFNHNKFIGITHFKGAFWFMSDRFPLWISSSSQIACQPWYKWTAKCK